MAEFLTELVASLLWDDKTWQLHEPLIYRSDIAGLIIAPAAFQCDFASVPRIPIIYELWGNRAHREAVIHDLMYCTDSFPLVSFGLANKIFLEAMVARSKPWYVRQPMYRGVQLAGYPHYHKRKVIDVLCPPRLITI